MTPTAVAKCHLLVELACLVCEVDDGTTEPGVIIEYLVRASLNS